MMKPPTRKTPFTLLAPVPLFILAILASGCAATRPLRGGKATITSNPFGGVQQTLAQGDNPSQPTKQDQETIRIRTYTLPAGTRIEQSVPLAAPAPSTIRTHSSHSALNPATPERSAASTTVIVSGPTSIVEREETRAKTELGAAQKDTARELGAKLSSLKPIVWVGLGLFVFGLASLAWPPLKTIIGSVTTSAAITLGGLALIILPTLVVGHEPLILGAVALTVTAWFLAHRHGHLRGTIDTANARAPSRTAPPPRHSGTPTLRFR